MTEDASTAQPQGDPCAEFALDLSNRTCFALSGALLRAKEEHRLTPIEFAAIAQTAGQIIAGRMIALATVVTHGDDDAIERAAAAAAQQIIAVAKNAREEITTPAPTIIIPTAGSVIPN